MADVKKELLLARLKARSTLNRKSRIKVQRKVPVQLFPRKVLLQHRKDLREIVREMQKLAMPLLNPLIENIQINFEKNKRRDSIEIRLDAISDDIERIFKEIRLRFRERFTTARKERIANATARSVDAFNKEQVNKQFKRVIGIELGNNTPRINESINMYIRENVRLINSLESKALDQIEQIVISAARSGLRVEELSKDIQDRFSVAESRANLIARDQTNKLNGQLTMDRQKEIGINSYTWRTAGDERVRPIHAELEGQTFSWDDPPVTNPQGEQNHPGGDYNCFPGESNIVSFDIVNKLFRRWYTGELTELICSNGVVLKATPNHPILTESGWIAIKDIQIGQNIISTRNQSFNTIEEYIKKTQVSFQDCFDTATFLFGHSVDTSSHGKFHGDISDNKVDIITFDCDLPSIWNISFIKDFAEFIFTWSDSYSETILPSYSDIISMLCGSRSSFQGIVSCFSKLFSFFDTESKHSLMISFRAIPDFDIMSEKAVFYNISGEIISFRELINADTLTIEQRQFFNRQILKVMRLYFSAFKGGINTPSAQMLANNVGTAIEGYGDLGKSIAFPMQSHRVIDKRFSIFSNHVYNLESANSYYAINKSNESLIVHNCRCEAIPVFNDIYATLLE